MDVTRGLELENNHLLACLPLQEKQILQRYLERDSLKTKEVINEVGSLIRYLHFPIDCAISLMDSQLNGRAVEVTVVGREGCAGFTALLGSANSPGRSIAQVGGEALRLEISSLLPLLDTVQVFHKALIRFSALILREAVISVGCSQFHSVEQRLGRWLLAHEHRTGLTIFPFTHDFLAEQLGVQRVTVTAALSAFQDRGLAKYSYGKVELVDRRAMEKATCECFGLAKQAVHEFLRDIKSYEKPC